MWLNLVQWCQGRKDFNVDPISSKKELVLKYELSYKRPIVKIKTAYQHMVKFEKI